MKLEVTPEVTPEVNLVVDRLALKKLIAQVWKAAPTRPGRLAVSAMKFESDGKRIRAIASDGYRIAISEVPLSVMKFPQCKKPLAITTFKTELTFPAHSLKSALFQLKPAIDRYNPRVTFKITGTKVRICAGSLKTELAGAKVSGEKNKVSLNPHFISDFLDPADGEVMMQVNDGKSLVRLSNGPEYVHFIMPLWAEPKKRKRSQLPERSGDVKGEDMP